MKLQSKIILIASIGMLGFVACNKDFLDKQPLGSTSENTLANKAGVSGLLIGAYSMLDGIGGPSTGGAPYSQSISNWVFGGVASDDAHKGSTDNDQGAIADIEKYAVNSSTSYLNGKWVALYTGIQRSNDVLRTMAKVTDGSLSEQDSKVIKGEALFLRAIYHFEAAKIWKNIPYVDETVNYENGNYNVTNDASAWPKIEADFKFAVDNLPSTQPDRGRANAWAAKSFLAKVYMFQNKHAEAKVLFDDIIANGVTASGQKYALVSFHDNFDASKKNNSESIFAVQMSVKDGAAGANNGNIGDLLNFPYGGPTSCCGFYQPSFSLANTYKTDASGLPLPDTYNNADIANDQGIASTQAFTPYAGTLDPRLDYTVGRRGIPYLDWGVMPGQAWVRSQIQAGPYIPKKNVIFKSQVSNAGDNAQGWGVNQATAINYVMIRYADLLLMAAEAEVEVGSLTRAQELVNRVRIRAADPAGWPKTYIDNDPAKGFSNTPAANYKVEPYPAGMFDAQGKDFSRKAVRFERRLELAMEGHRFFDLQRWDNGTGYMANELNAYIQHETTVPGFNYQILKGAQFTKGKNEIFPIPLAQIDLSKTEAGETLKQNSGY